MKEQNFGGGGGVLAGSARGVRRDVKACGGRGGGKQGEEASWENAFIFCKESGLSAGGNGQGFSTGATRIFAPDTDHSGNSVGAVLEPRDCRQDAGPGHQTCWAGKGDRTASGQGHGREVDVLGVGPGSFDPGQIS